MYVGRIHVIQMVMHIWRQHLNRYKCSLYGTYNMLTPIKHLGEGFNFRKPPVSVFHPSFIRPTIYSPKLLRDYTNDIIKLLWGLAMIRA